MAHTEYPDPGPIPSQSDSDIDAETAALMRDLLSSVGEPELVSQPPAESVIDMDRSWEPDSQADTADDAGPESAPERSTEPTLEPLPVSTPDPVPAWDTVQAPVTRPVPDEAPSTDDPVLASLPPIDLPDIDPAAAFLAGADVSEPRTVGEEQVPDLRSAPLDEEKSPPRPVVFPGAPTTIDEAVDFEYAAKRRIGKFPSLPLVMLVVLGIALAAATYWGLSQEAGGASVGGYDVYTTSLYALGVLAVLGLVVLIPLFVVAKKRMPNEKGVFGQVLFRVLLVIAFIVGFWFLAVTAGQTWPLVTL